MSQSIEVIYGFELVSIIVLQDEQKVRFSCPIHGTWPQSVDSEDISGL